MDKTLYITDLDGTLLRGDETLSAYSRQTINRLVEAGLCFSYATARSRRTAEKVTGGLAAGLPRIVYNGAFVVDGDGAVLLSSYFDDAADLLKGILAQGVYPIVYAMRDGVERFSWLEETSSPGVRAFVASRPGDPRANPVHDPGDLLRGEVFYITCIDDAEKLEPLYRAYHTRCHAVYQRDVYTGEPWLELMPPQASKASAARRLKALLGCTRLVAFGDGLNDLELFRLADECYAVANAAPQLKALATAVIASNEDDGVARWLARHAAP